MKYYLIAGERSGDMHAANLMRAIIENDANAEFRYFGGDAMQAVGGTLVKHYKEMAFMGVWEVLMNLRTISRLLKACRQDVEAWQPDAIILVDYSGFNLRIAQYIKDKNLPIKTIFYISPKVWAYRQKRALRIKRLIDCMLVIFPFEVDFYQKFDYKVHYVGNPLLDSVAQFTPNPQFRQAHQLTDTPIIALLPGSRKQELAKILPTMLEATVLLKKDERWQYQFIVAGVTNLDKSLYKICEDYPHVKIVWDSSYDLLQEAQGAIVTSGTATLETALLRVPQVVVYRTSWLTYEIVKRIIKVPYISLVNLIAQKEVVKELIQQECTPQKIHEELRKVLPVVGELHYQTLSNYDALKMLMGEAGASTHAATVIKDFLGASTQNH